MKHGRIVSGTIIELHCQSCGAKFPHFIFSGETDIDTTGLCSASVCNEPIVIITEIHPNEWSTFTSAMPIKIETRLRQETGLTNIKIPQLLKVEIKTPIEKKSNFRNFISNYRPPELIYSCICCSSGECRTTSERSIEEFIKLHGTIQTIGNIILEQPRRNSTP